MSRMEKNVEFKRSINKDLEEQISRFNKHNSRPLFEGMCEVDFSSESQVSWMMIYKVLGQIRTYPEKYNMNFIKSKVLGANRI